MQAERHDGLRVGGLTRFTTIDFPGRLAAVVFCQGCPWRCTYCHNPGLLPARSAAGLHWEDVLRFLSGRRGLLDGVVFSGGEPTTQAALPDALRAVREMGFAVGLHTAGMHPRRLASALPWLDWVGLDIKGPSHAYARITGRVHSGAAPFESLKLLMAAGVAYEIRCTWHPDLLSIEDIDTLCVELRRLGAQPPVLQHCRPPAGTGGLRTLNKEDTRNVTDRVRAHFGVCHSR
ncbi:MAG: anaerobic ribonucleoside-triphosphate reductase activating protein [Methyloversatilis discipulorum]|nr:anaerobic ribonucleoside-triphosphate reductase activating protein [Methyloversatilis discipulorum]